MSNHTAQATPLAPHAAHPRHDRQRVLRWATVTLLLLLAAVAASRT
jgi:hypothetical protein